MDTQRFLELLSTAAPSGAEQGMAALLSRLLPEYEVKSDALGSVLVTVKAEGERHLLLEAHMDQVGFVVTQVMPEGFVRLAPVGGIDPRLMPGTRLRFLDGDGTGVVCAVPPHLKQGEKDKVQPVTDCLVDVGPAAAKRIPVGERAVYAGKPVRFADGTIASPALDNRAGMAVLLETIDRLRKDSGPYAVSALFAVREEVGNAGGAVTGSAALSPDLCVAVDVSFGMQPGVQAHKCGKMGGGPMIGFAPALDTQLCRALVNTAQQEGLPFQREIMAGDTSTDADGILSVGCGVRTALLSVPIRNMHGPLETVCVQDIDSTAALLAAAVRKGALE